MEIAPVMQLDGWTVEIKSMFFRKTGEHGKQYSGVLTATVVNGTLAFELFHCDNFTIKDRREVVNFVKSIGYDDVEFIRFNNGKKMTRKIA